jgi:hypothetical protein
MQGKGRAGEEGIVEKKQNRKGGIVEERQNRRGAL